MSADFTPLHLGDFTIEADPIPLPRGAFAKARRLFVRWRDRPITALCQGEYRAYLFPLYTPAGFNVTTESPIDHPHHNSLWIAADHIHCRLPYGADAYEEATYNFYVNETFQGRAAGRILALDYDAELRSEEHLAITQTLEWRGPPEWGAPDGRRIAKETRTYAIQPGVRANIIDITSQFSPTEWDLSIGPCRHAWFGARLAESIRRSEQGVLRDADGRRGEHDINGQVSAWVDFSGPAGGGHTAGMTLIPHPAISGAPWYLADWGMLSVNPFQHEKKILHRSESLTLGVRAVIHDGAIEDLDIKLNN